MFVVRERESRTIVYVDHAAERSDAGNEDVYPEFDPLTTEAGWSSAAALPEHFKISADGEVVELSPGQMVERGILTLELTQKLEDGAIIDKTVAEQVAEGLIELAPGEKLVGDRIVEMTLAEQVAEGLVELGPSEKIENDQIVVKTAEEEIDDGTLRVDEPFECVTGNFVATRTIRELVENELLTTREHCERALSMLGYEIEQSIAGRYSSGRELNLLKGYVEWLAADKPADDAREQGYLEMQIYISNVKADYEEFRRRIMQTMEGLD